VSARVRYERGPDGRLVEVFGGGPKVKVEQVTHDRSDVHPELKGERLITETYSSEEVQEWATGLGCEGERKIDGEVSGVFPRRSRLAAAMVEADLDAEALAAKAMLPASLIERLIDSGDVPGDDQRRQLEAVVPDPFPECGELIEPSPNELLGGVEQSRTKRHRGEPAPTRNEAEARSRRRAQLAAEVRQAADRRAAVARRQGERDAARLKELDRGLSGVARRLRRLGRQ
jgi:hypothetical protein